jgi:hypothetical protein
MITSTLRSPTGGTSTRSSREDAVALFDPDTARRELARLMPMLDEFVAVRADAAELTASLDEGGPSTDLGGLPELKAAQARLDELMTFIQESGVQLKGYAPLLLDFPSELDGVPVLLCWLEGEAELGWYHRVDLGFAGRRRVP